MTKFSHLVFEIILFSFVKFGATQVTSIQEYWHEMDPNYDLSYLHPVDETYVRTKISCAVHASSWNADVFGYLAKERLCYLYDIDFFMQHILPAIPGLKLFLKNEVIDTDHCLDSECGFCMPILESPMTWDEANTACYDLNAGLLEMTDGGMHRCVVMQLQYLRKPTSNRYWLGGQYDDAYSDWEWAGSGAGTPAADYLWETGEPDNPGTEDCVLLVPGGNYTMRSADCSEKHYALCVEI